MMLLQLEYFVQLEYLNIREISWAADVMSEEPLLIHCCYFRN